MNTKQYLRQVGRANSQIKFKRDEIERLRVLATNIASTQGDGMNIQRTRNMDKMGSAVAKMVDLEKSIKVYEQTYLKIMDQIDDIDVPNFHDIIIFRYIEHLPFDVIADNMSYSLSHTKKLHRQALAYFESIYGQDYL